MERKRSSRLLDFLWGFVDWLIPSSFHSMHSDFLTDSDIFRGFLTPRITLLWLFSNQKQLPTKFPKTPSLAASTEAPVVPEEPVLVADLRPQWVQAAERGEFEDSSDERFEYYEKIYTHRQAAIDSAGGELNWDELSTLEQISRIEELEYRLTHCQTPESDIEEIRGTPVSSPKLRTSRSNRASRERGMSSSSEENDQSRGKYRRRVQKVALRSQSKKSVVIIRRAHRHLNHVPFFVTPFDETMDSMCSVN